MKVFRAGGHVRAAGAEAVRVFRKAFVMGFGSSSNLASGTKVRVIEAMDVPEWSTWDDDKGRTSGSVKKRLQQRFFRKDPKLTAEIVYIASEEVRERLRRKGQIKVRIRDQSGCALVVTADPAKLVRGH